MILTFRLLFLVGFFVSTCSGQANDGDYEEYEHVGARRPVQRGSGVQRVHNGNLAEPGQFKFIVGINIQASIANPDDDYEHEIGGVCTGALVTSRFVLTASHCVPRVVIYVEKYGDDAVPGFTYSNVRFDLVAGTVDMSASNASHAQRVSASFPEQLRLHVHPDAYMFRPKIEDKLRGRLVKDFALLELTDASFKMDDGYIATIPILKTPIPATLDDRCYAVGFGNQDDLSNARDSKLYHIEVKVGGEGYCDELRGRPYKKTFHLCAAGEGMRDTCAGDSGGPLVCGKSGQYYLSGVLSVGTDTVKRNGSLKGCGETSTSFGVYVYPGVVEDWVINITKEVHYVTREEAKEGRVTRPVTTTSTRPPGDTSLPTTTGKKPLDFSRKIETEKKSSDARNLHLTDSERITIVILLVCVIVWNAERYKETL